MDKPIGGGSDKVDKVFLLLNLSIFLCFFSGSFITYFVVFSLNYHKKEEEKRVNRKKN